MKLFSLLLLLLPHLQLTAQDNSVNQFAFSSQGQQVTMAYRYGKAISSNAKTVLLLHGKNFSGSYWKDVIYELLSNGYNVIAPDQIGFGNSSKPGRYQYSFHQLAYNTKQLLDTLGISNVIVLGHSMGGMLATRFALQYPQYCSRLVLEAPIGLEDWKLIVPYSTIDEEYQKEKQKTVASVKKYFLDSYFHQQWKPAYDTLLQQSTALLNDTAYAKSMALTSDMIYTQPVLYEFSKLKMPVTLIVGMLDKTAIGKERVSPTIAAKLGNYPVLSQQAAAAIPNCKLVQLKGIGHIPHIENRELFMAALLKAIDQ